MNWYVLFVTGGKEKQIVKFLNNQFSDWQAFCPMVQKIHVRKKEPYIYLKPAFPNYVFVRSEIVPSEFNRRIFEVRQQKSGIIRDLEYEHGQISALRPDEIYYFEHLLNDHFEVVPSKGVMQNGRVHIVSGPLMGLEEQIIKVNRHNQTAIVQLELLGERKTASVALEIVPNREEL